MGSKWLQAVGVLAIVGLVAGSVGALLVVKQRIHVTIAAEEAAAQRGPDPIELLRADVGVLSGDLAALNKGVGDGLQALHDASEGAAGEREQRLSARIDALEARLAALQTSSAQHSAKLAAEIASLTERVAESRVEAQLAAEVAAKASEAAPVAAAPVDPEPEAVVALPTPPLPPAPAAQPPKKGFLSFQLPSTSFAFDQRQRFAILPSLSRVGFDGKSTLHDFSGVTSKVEGNFSVNLAMAGEKPGGTITVDAGSMETGLEDRDTAMRKSLDVAQYKSISFEWNGFTADAIDAKAQTVTGKASGRMTIHGQTRDVTMPVKVAVDGSKRVSIDGELTIKLSDYGVVPPSQLGVINVEDELKLWIALRARSLGPAKEGE